MAKGKKAFGGYSINFKGCKDTAESIFGGWEGVRRLVPEPIRDDVGRRIAERRADQPS